MGLLPTLVTKKGLHSQGTMQIFVKTFENTVTLDVAACDTVRAVKAGIESVEGVAASQQCLSFAGVPLEEDATLESYGVNAESTLSMTMRLLGGGKKRKRKVYSTPKKIKHKHQKVKLRVLKYYKVDENSKIMRLRRECTEPECGPGVFLANHADRHYCGKCHL